MGTIERMFNNHEIEREFMRTRLRHIPGKPVDAEELATARGISVSRAEQIIVDLRNAGLLESPQMARRGDGTGGEYLPAAIRVL